MFEAGDLACITERDCFGWHEVKDGKLGAGFVFLNWPEPVLMLSGVEKVSFAPSSESKKFDTYLKVLSSQGVVWVGDWCLMILGDWTVLEV